MKKMFSLLMMALFAMPSFAQISEGEPRAEVLPTGNRLEQGVWGVYFGAGFTFDKKDNDFNDSKCHVTPLVNVKYMFTDNIEGRIGVEFGKNKTRNGFEDNNDKDGLQKTISSHNYFNPGVAYHFSKKNILDVYMGAEVPFGWERNTAIVKYDDEHQGSTFDNKFNVGAGAFIGLQAFIGRLPLSLGLEYGIQSLFTVGDGKVKTVYGDQTTYGQGFKSMSSRKGEILSQARITLSYYFK